MGGSAVASRVTRGFFVTVAAWLAQQPQPSFAVWAAILLEQGDSRNSGRTGGQTLLHIFSRDSTQREHGYANRPRGFAQPRQPQRRPIGRLRRGCEHGA